MKKMKKTLSILLVLCMAVSMFAGLGISANAAEAVLAENNAAGYNSGMGTENDPYIIATSNQLAYLASQVNSGNTYSGKYFKLDCNIDLSGAAWTPIGGGSSAYDFAGSFDGNNKIISNLNISAASQDNIGLFGSVSGTVKKVVVSSGSVEGGKNTGAVVGKNYGTVTDCSNIGCSVTSAGLGQGVGGVVGSCWNDGTITNCYNSAAVSGTGASTYAGGIVGKAESSISGCTNSGSVTSLSYCGGIVGYAAVHPDNCTNSSSTPSDIMGYLAAADASDTTNVTSGGSYHVIGDATFNISTDEPVSIVGNGTAYRVSIIYSTAANLTISDLKVSGPATAASNIIDFAEGTSNILNIEGTSVLENDNTSLNCAMIHVENTADLTSSLDISGAGTLYMYKNSMGAAIGADTGEANGAVTINSGNIFIKGSKTGALIGNDTTTNTALQNRIGDITIKGGNINLVNKAQGAGIGGSRMSVAKNCKIEGGNVTLVTDYNAPVIGAGAQKKNASGANGNLIVTGGSVKTMVTSNGYSGFNINSSKSEETTDVAIKADKTNGTDPVYLYKLDVSNISPVDGEYTVRVDNEQSPYYKGGLHQYHYTASTTSTTANWTPTADNCLYLYLTAGNHSIDVNGTTVNVDWDSSASSFTTSAVNPSDEVSLAEEDDVITIYPKGDGEVVYWLTNPQFNFFQVTFEKGKKYLINMSAYDSKTQAAELYFKAKEGGYNGSLDGVTFIIPDGTTFSYFDVGYKEKVDFTIEGAKTENGYATLNQKTYDGYKDSNGNITDSKGNIYTGAESMFQIYDDSSLTIKNLNVAINPDQKLNIKAFDQRGIYTGSSAQSSYYTGTVNLENVNMTGCARLKNYIIYAADATLNNVKFDTTDIPFYMGTTNGAKKSTLTINSIDYSSCTGTAISTQGELNVMLNPTGDIKIGGSIISKAAIKVTPQDGYDIESMTVNGKSVSVPTKETTLSDAVTSGLNIKMTPPPATYTSSITADKESYKTGETVTVTAALTPDSAESLASGEMKFTYDTEKLEFINAAPNTTVLGDNAKSSVSEGVCVASFKTDSGSEVAVSEDTPLTLATFTFEAKAVGTADFTVTKAVASAKEKLTGSTVNLPKSATSITLIANNIKIDTFGSDYKLLKYKADALPESGNAYYVGDTMLTYVPAYSQGDDAEKYVFVALYKDGEEPAAPMVETKTGTYETITATGDVNKDTEVDIIDAQVVMYIVASKFTSATNGIDWLNSDVNGDGAINALDSQAIQYYVHYDKFGTFN